MVVVILLLIFLMGIDNNDGLKTSSSLLSCATGKDDLLSSLFLLAVMSSVVRPTSVETVGSLETGLALPGEAEMQRGEDGDADEDAEARGP